MQKSITRLRVLFDKNVPYGVRRFLAQHEVETVEERGWGQISNGQLIVTAEHVGFHVVVTADQNIVYQQNLKGRQIALVVLGSNIWPIVREQADAISAEVDAAKPGGYAFIKMAIPSKRRPTFGPE